MRLQTIAGGSLSGFFEVSFGLESLPECISMLMARLRQQPVRNSESEASQVGEASFSVAGRPNKTPVCDQGDSTAKRRIIFAIFVAAVYVLPPILVLTNVVPYRHRFTLLAVVTAMTAVYVWLRGDGLAALGFRRDTFGASLRYNSAVTAAGLLIIAALFFSGVLPIHGQPPWRWFFLVYMVVSCPAQEFLFRSVLFAEMDRAGITQRGWQVGWSSVLYCFPHVVYRSVITLFVVLVIGVVWGYGFSRDRNFWGVAASHCILGAVSVLAGLI